MNIEQKRQALGKRIRAVREEQGLSQSPAGPHDRQQQVPHLAHRDGRVRVGIDDLGRIADALGSPVRDLLTF